MTLKFPLPAPELRPNGRAFYMQKGKATRKAREAAFFAVLSALGVQNLPAFLSFKDLKKLGLSGQRDQRFYHRLSSLLLPSTPPRFRSYTLVYRFRSRACIWDDDNAIASTKAHRDGIAHALRIDDKHLRLHALPALLVDPKHPGLTITLVP